MWGWVDGWAGWGSVKSCCLELCAHVRRLPPALHPPTNATLPLTLTQHLSTISLGPGAVLHSLIASKLVPVVDLREIFRQAAESAIITSALAGAATFACACACPGSLPAQGQQQPPAYAPWPAVVA